MSQNTKNVLIIELNAFNTELLSFACEQHALPAITKMLNMPRSSYKTHDRFNSGYLEPWVQWVSIHTACPSREHHIKHLGDIPTSHEQCWEVLSKHDITTGVWGSMNAIRGNANNTLFFLPDLWTVTESTPAALNRLLSLPRYLSNHYPFFKKWNFFTQSLRLFPLFFKHKLGNIFLKECLSLLRNWQPDNNYGVLMSSIDYLSALLFCHYKKHYNPRCTFLLLNTLARAQRYYWQEGPDSITPEILLSLRTIDKILTLLFEQFPQDAIIIHNGLSQMNTHHERLSIIYRPRNLLYFLRTFMLNPEKIEPSMEYAYHILFNDTADCNVALQTLKQLKHKNKSLFHVESCEQNPLALFFQLKFTDSIDSETPVIFEYHQQQYNFLDFFEPVGPRTSRNIPIGIIYSDTLTFPDQIDNHRFNRYLYHYLLPEKFRLRENIEQEIFET
jgi:hypothetical protein